MVEYALIASQSAAFLTGIFGRLQNLLDAIPFGSPVFIGTGIAIVFYILFRKR